MRYCRETDPFENRLVLLIGKKNNARNKIMQEFIQHKFEIFDNSILTHLLGNQEMMEVYSCNSKQKVLAIYEDCSHVSFSGKNECKNAIFSDFASQYHASMMKRYIPYPLQLHLVHYGFTRKEEIIEILLCEIFNSCPGISNLISAYNRSLFQYFHVV